MKRGFWARGRVWGAGDAAEAVNLLTNANQQAAIVRHNYKIGKKHFSMDALYLYLEQLRQQFKTTSMIETEVGKSWR